MATTTQKQLPSQGLAVIDAKTGLMNPIWYRFFLLFTSNALVASGAQGYIVSTTTGVLARTIIGTSNQITITNGNGISGNTVVGISNNYAGQTTIVTLGTVTTGTWTATKIAEVYGGTNQKSYAVGDILYSSATNVLSKLSGNITTTTKYLQQIGNGSVSAAPTWSQISLTAGVTGILPVTNGGVDQTAFTTFTPTCTGFTGTPTTTGAYKQIGKILYIRMTVSGTSNADTFTITNLPVAASNTITQTVGIFLGSDSGINTSVTGSIAANTTTLTLQKGITTSGAWTNSGTKELFANFFYETV